MNRRSQNGIALVALLGALALGASYFLYDRLNASPSAVALARSKHDAAILSRAKAALVGQVALNTAGATEVNPGRLPCPEALADAGTANEGLPAMASAGNPFGVCAAGAVGRLPWKLLGLEKPLDSSGEPLWYAVGPGWVQAAAGATLVINSDSPAAGGLSLSGTDAVAILFAPGTALPGQARTAVNGAAALQVANYLDGGNSAPLDLVFVAQAAGAAFNDRALALTREELLPAIEAAVADRFERQVAPGMRTAYSGAPWTATPTLPFAVPFADPSVAPANRFRGAAGTARGLLPATYATAGACSPAPCTPAPCDAADPRCDASFLAFQPAAVTVTRTGGALYQEHSCSVAGTPQVLTCEIRGSTSLFSFANWMAFNMTVRISNAAMGFRAVNGTVVVGGVDTGAVNAPYGYTVNSAVLNTDGSATIAISSRFAGGSGSVLAALGSLTCTIFFIPLCYEYTISIPVALLSDHPVVDPANASTNWFFRNRWHELAHYAVAPSVAPSQAAPRGCTTLPSASTPCLQASYLASPSAGEGSLRGIVLFAGRSLSTAARPAGQVRPSGDPLDWFEDLNAGAASPYATRAPDLAPQRAFNDRVVVLDHN